MHISEQNKRHMVRLDSAHSTVVLELEPGSMPLWRHWGARLGATTPLLSQWGAADARRRAPGSMDRLDGQPLFPGFGNALPCQPALRGHCQLQRGVQEWVLADAVLAPIQDGQNPQLTLTLVDALDPAQSLQVVLQLTLWHATGVLEIQTALHNRGAAPWALEWLASGAVCVAANLSEVAHFSGQWGNEFVWNRAPIGGAGWSVSNRHGRTSHELPPAVFLLTPDTTDHQGDALGLQLAWSGNHAWHAEVLEDGRVQCQAGVWWAPGEGQLAPGAQWTAPALLATWSAHGLNGVASNFHAHVRRHCLPWNDARQRPRPVHLNTWEAVYFNHDAQTLKDLAQHGAALGIERFVLDDGWFPGRPNDRSGLGDWWPDPQKYPQGLAPLIQWVQHCGMEFGLWVEPEMVSPDSQLYRSHPDWALQVQGAPLQLGRQQLVLNIARPEVADYLFEKLDVLLRNNAISYLKWDMNRDLAQALDAAGRFAYAQQVSALYGLLARLRQAHPQVEIESCASGGGRMDLGILQYTQRFWTSDNNDAVSRVAIQSGATRLFPLEVLGAHVGPAPAHTTGRSQSLEFRCAVALFGHMGVEADVRKLTTAEAATLSRWIALYKDQRAVLHSGRFSQGKTANGHWWLVQTRDRALLGVYTLRPPATMHHAALPLPEWQNGDEGNIDATDMDTDTDTEWVVHCVAQAGQERARGDAASGWLDALRGDGVRIASSELRGHGLPLPNMNPESALVFSLCRQPRS